MPQAKHSFCSLLALTTQCVMRSTVYSTRNGKYAWISEIQNFTSMSECGFLCLLDHKQRLLMSYCKMSFWFPYSLVFHLIVIQCYEIREIKSANTEHFNIVFEPLYNVIFFLCFCCCCWCSFGWLAFFTQKSNFSYLTNMIHKNVLMYKIYPITKTTRDLCILWICMR